MGFWRSTLQESPRNVYDNEASRGGDIDGYGTYTDDAGKETNFFKGELANWDGKPISPQALAFASKYGLKTASPEQINKWKTETDGFGGILGGIEKAGDAYFGDSDSLLGAALKVFGPVVGGGMLTGGAGAGAAGAAEGAGGSWWQNLGKGVSDFFSNAGTTAAEATPWGVNAPGGGMFDLGDPSTWAEGFGEFNGATPDFGSFGTGNAGVLPFDPGDPSTWGQGYGEFNGATPNFGGPGTSSSTLAEMAKELAKKVGPEAAKSLFSKIMSEGLTGDNLGKLIGALGPAALGMLGANQQSNSLEKIADQQNRSLMEIYNQTRADRQPFLDYSKGLLAGGPAAYGAGAGADSLKGILQQLSVQGNPLGSGTSMQLATDAGLKNWQGAWQGAAGIGLGGQALNAQLGTNAANAQASGAAGIAGSDANMWNAGGYGLQQLFGQPAPKYDLASILKGLA